MQDKKENLLTSTDKIRALKAKLKVWSVKVKNRTYDMFYHFSERKNIEVTSLITNHLASLEENLENYVHLCAPDNYTLVKTPFFLKDAHVKSKLEGGRSIN